MHSSTLLAGGPPPASLATSSATLRRETAEDILEKRARMCSCSRLASTIMSSSRDTALCVSTCRKFPWGPGGRSVGRSGPCCPARSMREGRAPHKHWCTCSFVKHVGQAA